MDLTHAPKALTDDQLLRRVADLVGRSRATEAEIVAHIAEVDARRLYAREACPSMYVYCTERLRFSEAETYLRIAAARASRQHPTLLSMLADGRLHLSAIERLAPHLTPENRDAVLARAAHRTKRQVEELVAELAPRPDAPALIRRLPVRVARAGSQPQAAGAWLGTAVGRSAGSELQGSAQGVGDQAPAAGGPIRRDGEIPLAASGRSHDVDGGAERPTVAPVLRSDGVGVPVQPPVVEPTAPGRYKVQFTAGAELREKLERLQALMRRAGQTQTSRRSSSRPSEKLERLEAVRYAKVKQPRAAAPAAVLTGPATATATGPAAPIATGPAAVGPTALAAPAPTSASQPSAAARRIPNAIRRAVYARDGGRCRYTDREGRRCTARHDLEFHHRHPFGYGGAHTVDNVCLTCAVHNRMLGESDYGRLGPSRPWQLPRRHPTP